MTARVQAQHIVYLYAPISASREYAPLSRSWLGHLRAGTLRTRDRVLWKLSGSCSFEYYSWRRFEYTNRGDIAIREAVKQLLAERSDNAVLFRELDWGDLRDANLSQINTEADLFVICGGGYVFRQGADGEFSPRMGDVAALSQIRCPVVAFGIGHNFLLESERPKLDRSLSSEAAEKLRALASTMELIGVRDCDLLQMLGAAGGKPAELIGDPALFLSAAKDLPLVSRGIHPELRVGINFALHGPVSAKIFQSNCRAYARFLDRLQKSGSKLYYFVHCRTERIAVAILREHGIQMEVIDLTPAQMSAAYGQMDLVICQMLHSSVLATNAGVPSANIAYDQKNIAFHEMMDLPDMCIFHQDVTEETLWELFVRLRDSRHEVVAKIDSRMAILRRQIESFVDSAAQIVHEHAADV